jgi:hypothetical protein
MLGQVSCIKGGGGGGVTETPVAAQKHELYGTKGSDERKFNDQVSKAQQALFRARNHMKCKTGKQKSMVGFGFKCVGCPNGYYGIQLSGDDLHPMCVECPLGKFTLETGQRKCLTDVTKQPTQAPTSAPTSFPTERGETIVEANLERWKAKAKVPLRKQKSCESHTVACTCLCRHACVSLSLFLHTRYITSR